MILARAALSLREVVLEVGVGRGDRLDALQRLGRERRPTEVRVHDDAGRVQNAAQSRCAAALEDVEGVRDDVVRLLARRDPLASRVDRVAGGVHGEVVPVFSLQRDEPLVLQELVYRGQCP